MMTGRNWSALIFSGTALVFLSAAAQAQTPSKAQQDAIRSNCRSDFMRNCSSVTPGGREALECLVQNKAKVSGSCQAALNAVAAPAAKPEPKPETRSEPAAPAAAPPAAAATAAPNSQEAPKAPPPAAARPAPKTAPKSATAPARAAPPPPAAAAVPPPPAAEAAPSAPRPMRLSEAFVIRRYCFNDFKVLCRGVQLGQGRAVRCLADNRDALSPGCRQALANAGN